MRFDAAALLAMIATGAYLGVKGRPASPYNDASFTPRHPTPVLYVHGAASALAGFNPNARLLRQHGYWTWGYNYGATDIASIAGRIPGINGFGELDSLVDELSTNIDHVKDATGAPHVDIVAHSQGGLLTRIYIARGGGANIRRVVGIGANFHGTDLRGRAEKILPLAERLPSLASRVAGPGALQQIAGSPFWETVADLPVVDPGVVYTTIYSPADHVVTPNSASMLPTDAGADVVNINLAEKYPGAARVSHARMPGDPYVAQLTLWGLERESTH
ncbi:esterase/lipase family protein [Corynebacterium liangguodongii]|uniref:Triacylglycerol lipase n=1 Tax=Corynebacterium liangguodongii TaxID=2079535 RepID=A0A2S0WGB9_9CORY|nr:alpha/beta fold hydrolase [Corynebacterium liangguodongii]AWB84825.1 triacylglycerol lipase [Corynebacterium liangguodongii]PWB99182.1 triacylglycerol lipase [Corynebacterium liangguodongii]